MSGYSFQNTPKSKQNHKQNYLKISTSFTLIRATSFKSMIFLEDVMSTSTPTRKRNQPLCSTPNTSTHNANDHHPSRTIRRKRPRINYSPQFETKTDIVLRKKNYHRLCFYRQPHHCNMSHRLNHLQDFHELPRTSCIASKQNETKQQTMINNKKR